MADKKSSNLGALAAGIASITAAAVGAYYLYGSKNASKNRAKVKSWMLKAKGEVLEQLENVQEVTESAYMHALNAVVQKYNALKTIDQAELESFMSEMRNHWSGIKQSVDKATSKKAAPKKKAAAKAKKGKK
jgi:hypothetical protein